MSSKPELEPEVANLNTEISYARTSTIRAATRSQNDYDLQRDYQWCIDEQVALPKQVKGMRACEDDVRGM